eukprot:CAMPEP_0201689166 /NCGR_PEP_ID=MMETSP0578-20130828/2794_1 /ASSEMBLY_ACC=CAM_ASM_000663 /TAXON_ID=267565 /ORGANISM="Skeletonema grethea, Strain CCMP 1804" /LENGTH=74 /DNA_ID=CAMNT_0048173711 /DNA_START=23 /DNA_END=244 /DNA_ORIENTATION=+
MPGVTLVEREAFESCTALTDIECDKLIKFHEGAFRDCPSLRSINLPSIKVAKGYAFCDCTSLTDAKFGNKLRRI